MGEALIRHTSSLVEWKKWSCTKTDNSYYEDVSSDGFSSIGDTYDYDTYESMYPTWTYADYYWEGSSGGYSMGSSVNHSSWSTVGGTYEASFGSTQYVYQYSGIYYYTDTDGTSRVKYSLELVAIAELVEDSNPTYTKGTTSYGSVWADYGENPEEGTLVSGSLTGDFCVLYSGGSYYYYERV